MALPLDPKWRRKSLNRLVSDSEMAPARIAETRRLLPKAKGLEGGSASATSVIALRDAGLAGLVRERPP
jgi:hypothetical protein